MKIAVIGRSWLELVLVLALSTPVKRSCRRRGGAIDGSTAAEVEQLSPAEAQGQSQGPAPKQLVRVGPLRT